VGVILVVAAHPDDEVLGAGATAARRAAAGDTVHLVILGEGVTSRAGDRAGGARAAVSALQDDARQLAFYRCWTRKEAYIKALGEGLTMPLDTFDVSLCEQPELVRCRDGREDPAAWSMLDVSPGPEFVAAAALRGKEVVVRRFRLAMA